jgi:electron transfer flavoprotein alpha subunit
MPTRQKIFVLAEHRKGKLRDVTLEMLTKGKEMAGAMDAELDAVLLGKTVGDFAKLLSAYANRVLVVEDEKLENFNSSIYLDVLLSLIAEHTPGLILIGNTGFGMDLAPRLAIELDLPLITDCTDLKTEDGNLFAIREMYSGKINAKVSFCKNQRCIATIRQGIFSPKEGTLKGEIVSVSSPLTKKIEDKKFLEYVEATVGDVDITQADTIVAIGRGIKEEKNISLINEFAKTVAGVVAGSRPVIDSGWLPKERQVGQSGKTVKPKLYFAVGISGSFQHVSGMRGAGLVVAINKDAGAPIFSVANYGIVGDLFKVIPALNNKVKETKS